MNVFLRNAGLCLAGMVAGVSQSWGANVSNAGPSQTYGAVSSVAGTYGTSFNPAAGAYMASQLEGKTVAGDMAYGLDLEYGDVSELFDLIDGLSESFLSEGGSGTGGSGGSGSDLGSIDINNPDLDAVIDQVATEAGRLAAVLAIVASEAYARANIDGKFSMLFTADVAGGNLSLDYNASFTSGILGVTDELNFDADAALASLETAFALSPTDPPTEFDLTGGVFLTVDPATESLSVAFDNDSLMLTRAAKLQQLVLSYSHPFGDFAGGDLYWGVSPKLIQAGLSNVAFRIGDITDSEKIFEDILDAEFETSTAFGLNAGVLWVADRYSLGASVHDLLESEFDFPAIDVSPYTNPDIIDGLQRAQSFKLKRQLKLEGSLLSANKKWSLNTAVDANAVEDVLGFEYQWFSLSGGFHTGNWIVPDVRLGYHKNLAGSELTFVGGGLTFLKFFTFDLSATLDDVSIDGDSLPRGIDGSLGFRYAF